MRRARSTAMRCRARRSFVAGVAAATLAIAFACGPRLPAPPFVGQPTSALVEVPYPPPPARVEVIPPHPSESGAVWIDGEWIWRTRRWAWKPGRWVNPPPNARFSPWTTVRDRRGTLYFAEGVWREASGAPLSDPEPLESLGPLPAAVVTPEGEEVREGPLVPLDAGPLDGGTVDAADSTDGGEPSALR